MCLFIAIGLALAGWFWEANKTCRTPTEDSPIENHCKYEYGEWVGK